MTHDFAKTLKRTEEELKLAGYSPRTVSSYLGVASRFLRFVDRPAEKISREDVRRYFVYLTERGQAPSSINQTHFGVRFLIKEVLKKQWRQPLRLHKRPQRMPIVLSRGEVRKLLTVTESVRYRTIWMAQYASGLRSSEVVRLRVCDIDSQAMRLLVRDGKGKKDRYTVLPEGLLGQLRRYWKRYRPAEYLFAPRAVRAAWCCSRSCLHATRRTYKPRGHRRDNRSHHDSWPLSIGPIRGPRWSCAWRPRIGYNQPSRIAEANVFQPRSSPGGHALTPKTAPIRAFGANQQAPIPRLQKSAEKITRHNSNRRATEPRLRTTSAHLSCWGKNVADGKSCAELR